MKRLFNILIVMCLFILPVRLVLAYELSLTGSDNIEKSLELKLDLTNLDEHDFYGLTAKLEFDNTKLELLEITAPDDLSVTYSAKSNKVLLYTVNGIKDKKTIANLKFKNIGLKENEEVTIKLTNINATDSLKDIKVVDISKKLKATARGSKSNTNLAEMTINGQKLELTEGELNYEIVVSNDTKEIDIRALPVDGEAIVNGDGVHELDEGVNEIKIQIKDKDGDIKTYTVNVNREDKDAIIDEDDLFIKSKKFKWNNLFFIPIGIVLLGIIALIIKKRKGIK